MRNRFRLPPHLCLANFAAMGGPEATRVRTSEAESGLAEYVASLLDRSLTWKDVEWLRSITTLPIVVKGVLSCEDAELAVRHGCAAIVVSNHGARQMDGVPATIEALGEVVQRVAGRCEVYMDGGVRRGADILKVCGSPRDSAMPAPLMSAAHLAGAGTGCTLRVCGPAGAVGSGVCGGWRHCWHRCWCAR